MTQAFNLSQLGNKVNTSGQLDASTGLTNITPVANGGTGRSSTASGNLLLGAGTSAMTALAGAVTNDVLGWNGTTWASSPVASLGGSSNYIQNAFTTPGTWTKAAGLKAIKVTVVGGGGNGGNSGPGVPGTNVNGGAGGGGGGGASIYYAPAPSIPGPQPITAGAGTNSFGAIASATGGSNGAIGVPSPATNSFSVGGNGGTGSGGQINISGSRGNWGFGGVPGSNGTWGGTGGQSILGFGGTSGAYPTGANGGNGVGYGGGGGGGYNAASPFTLKTGGTGSSGIVIIEEFY